MIHGFIILNRNIQEWEWYSDLKTFKLYMHLLINANFKDNPFQGEIIKRGQLRTGRKKLAAETGLSEQEVRTALNKLKMCGIITIKATNKYSLITLVNYDETQIADSNSNQQNNQQSTSNQPPNNNKNNGNNGDIYTSQPVRTKGKSKEPKHKYGEYQNVLLTDTEYSKLLNEFPLDYQEKIESLSEYMESTGKRYKNHLATIRSWAKKTEKGKNKRGKVDAMDVDF